MTQNGTLFHWYPLHDKCFEMIKHICEKAPVIWPIKPSTKEPIWLICDASKSEVGAMYVQWPTWKDCHPTGFMSKKFTTAQQNYAVHELEMLTILEVLLKWEDKLMGYEVHIITDHKALEFFKTQLSLTNRQWQWMDYLSRFTFDITYIKGDLNKVADCLSWYHKNDIIEDVYQYNKYVRADAWIDTMGEDLSAQRFKEMSEHVIEIRAMKAKEERYSWRLHERLEQHNLEAEEMFEATWLQKKVPPPTAHHVKKLVATPHINAVNTSEITLADMIFEKPNNHRPEKLDDDMFIQCAYDGYAGDKLLSLIEQKLQDYQSFRVQDNLIWKKNIRGDNVLCLPWDRDMILEILAQAHEIIGHFGSQCTDEYIQQWYWWPYSSKDIQEFCATCEACQCSKPSNQLPAGKHHLLPIPTKPWDSIGMDFIGLFLELKGLNYLWIIICWMTSMVHLIPVHMKMTASKLLQVYMQEIVRLHGLPSSIVSDRDSKFMLRWWRELHCVLGAKLLMLTSFHLWTDGQTECMNRNIGQIFWMVFRHDQKDWVDRADMTEFAINTSIAETTKFAPFKLNRGYIPSMLKEICSDRVIPVGIWAFAKAALQNLADAHDLIIKAWVFQTHRTNARRIAEPEIWEGTLVYLSTKNLNLPKGWARKPCSKFVGPYKIKQAWLSMSTYELELPTALQEWRINPVFHVLLLRAYHTSKDSMFSNRVHPEPYDFGAPDEHEWFVDKLLGHQ